MPGGLLAPRQQQFAGALSRETGLDPRVVGAWTLAEQSGGAAHGYEQRGYNNWLNIANTDSGPAAGAHSQVWRDPLQAARATAEWLRGQGPIAREYGRPAAGIQSILRSGRDPMAQINAIARSGWASSGYNGGADLRSLFGQLAGLRLPNQTAQGQQQQQQQQGSSRFIPGSPLGVSTSAQGGVDPQALGELLAEVKQMSAPAIAAAGASPTPPSFSAAPVMPAGAMTPEPLQPVSRQPDLQRLLERAFTGAGNVESKVTQAQGPRVEQTPGYAPAGSGAHAGGPLAGLLPAHAMLAVRRIDEGQDGMTNPGGPLVANGSGYVKEVKSDPGGFGPKYPVVVFTSGPLARFKSGVYLGHTLSALPQGARFSQGQVLSRTGTHGVGNATQPGWFEIGLADTLGQGNQGQGRLIAPALGTARR